MTRLQQQYQYATIAYADVFDYPLTDKEVHRWMIAVSTKKSRFFHDRYQTLPGRRHLIAKRKKLETIALKKWDVVRRILRIFFWIPTVRLIGVTGGLAMNNAKTSDDIDLFFITHPNAVWVTRLLAIITAECAGVRRRPSDRKVNDKICLNMFMAEDALPLPLRDRDLFAAHEVLQMVPIMDRGGVYQKFLSANRWVKVYLPNAWAEKVNNKQKIVHNYSSFTIFEPLAKCLQLWYMRNHRTTEVIDRGMLRFHPLDARLWVKRKFANRLKRKNIPLDIIFYHR